MALFGLFGKKQQAALESDQSASNQGQTVETSGDSIQGLAPEVSQETTDNDIYVAEAEVTQPVISESVLETQRVEPHEEDKDSIGDGFIDDGQKLVSEDSSTKQDDQGLFGRLRQGLMRTRSQLGEGLEHLFVGAKKIDDNLFEELETLLLMADVGVDATAEIMQQLTQAIARKNLQNPQQLQKALQEILYTMIEPCAQPLQMPDQNTPFVILMVGVNGAGKTTTIGKLCKHFQQQGKSVMLAAGDTFRAAAVEQLQTWGERNNVPVVAQHTGADSASVIYDAVQSAVAKNVDVLIADTAGRLQNKSNLMDELSKVVRVIQKIDATAPHEVMLVLDAGTGQNALSQVELFGDAVGVSGMTLTKLDGTARGGVVFALAKQSQLPIRFIGVGEKIEDLRPFNAQDFAAALFDKS